MTVYVLRSLKNGRHYIGITDKNPTDRLKEHNDGVTPSTRPHRPFELIYTEHFESAELARKREMFLKTGKGRLVLRSKIDEILSGH